MTMAPAPAMVLVPFSRASRFLSRSALYKSVGFL